MRGLLEISSNLTKTLQLDALFPKIGDSLFQLFRQADRCFLILAEDDGKKLIPKMVKTRQAGEETAVRFSRGIVRRCLNDGQAFLSAGRQKRRARSAQPERHGLPHPLRDVRPAVRPQWQGVRRHPAGRAAQHQEIQPGRSEIALGRGESGRRRSGQRSAARRDGPSGKGQTRSGAGAPGANELPAAQLPKVAGYEFYAHYNPANEVGGDYYGFIPLADGRLGVALGDVAGKGVPAALLMAKLSSDTRFSLLTERDLAERPASSTICSMNFTSPMDRFVTLAAAIVDPVKHSITFANAGHDSPMWYHQADRSLTDAVPVATAGLPLGIMEDYQYSSCGIVLQPGDCLVLFSDGLTDMVNPAGERFGFPGIREAVQDASGPVTPRILGELLLQAVMHHASGRERRTIRQWSVLAASIEAEELP